MAVGDPIRILPSDRHEDIWAVQKPLNFPFFVYGVHRSDRQGLAGLDDVLDHLEPFEKRVAVKLDFVLHADAPSARR